MHKRDGLSPTHEMYLKIIYQLGQTGDPARVGQMANGLGLHPSTVSAVVRTLDGMGLVTHDRYGIVKLTEAGRRIAKCVLRRFDTLRRFLIEALGLDQDTAEIEACEIEHAVSALTVARIENLVADLAQQGFKPRTDVPPSMIQFCAGCILANECTAAQGLRSAE